MTIAMDQWFWSSTSDFISIMSPTVKLRLDLLHFDCVWSEVRNSFLHHLQKLLTTNLKAEMVAVRVSALEFIITSTSIIKVLRASSFKLDPWVLSSDPNNAIADLIWCSQIPPKWLPAGVVFF